MASVWGILRGDRTGPRRIVLHGTAQILPGDVTLAIDIDPDIQAPAGRELLSNWTVVLTAEDGPIPTSSWNSLTQAQWNFLTQSQWNEMEQ